ncbi:MAG TPA: ABC transporter transmembrane domain-containing protein, partial [Rhodothermales bacterium]|nr:ABC transporter transmembrane domain-containing protein [Rhodothermales bacterium]
MATLTRLSPYYRTYARLFLPGLFCAIISAVFAVVVPVIVRQTVDGIVPFIEGDPGSTAAFGPLGRYLMLQGGIVIALTLLSGLFSFLMRQTLVVASRHIEYDLRERLYDALQKLPPSFFRALSTGDVITRATSDVEHVRRYVGPALMYAARAVTLVVLA